MFVKQDERDKKKEIMDRLNRIKGMRRVDQTGEKMVAMDTTLFNQNQWSLDFLKHKLHDKVKRSAALKNKHNYPPTSYSPK